MKRWKFWRRARSAAVMPDSSGSTNFFSKAARRSLSLGAGAFGKLRAKTSLRASLPFWLTGFFAYVPLMLSSPGKVGADTKTNLYLDPSRLLADATSLWDSDFALGTVTHQTIGYLWPMGPFYWLAEALGFPDWVAQRIWLGTVLFVTAIGVWFLLKTLGWSGRGVAVAMLAYQLSPYILHYSARISVILLPWAGLPWLIGLTMRASRQRGWKLPCIFALVVLTISSVNASAFLFVGMAPALWLLHATFVERSITVRVAVSTGLKCGVASLAVSLWWIAGLVVQGRYGLAVTRYTEPYEAVASASTAPEVLRGLGYWFFYGNDKFGQWIEPSIEYTQGVWLHFVSFGLVVFALLGAGLIRWRHRSFFVLLAVVGGLTAIASHPFDSPSFLGSLFREFSKTDFGLALRSTPRALPLLVLSVAVFLGMIANATHRRWPKPANCLTVLILAAIVINNPAIWRLRMIEAHLHRNEEVPTYWVEAASWLNVSGKEGRIWEVPGSDFASYRWGNTVDPITPALVDRGYVARELVPFGTPHSAALVNAIDRKMQEDTFESEAIAPLARLMSVDDLLHRADLSFERYRTPRPILFADQLARTEGLEKQVSFGDPLPNVAGPSQTLIDEVHLGISADLRHPSPIVVHEISDSLDVARLRPLFGGTILVGDAEGIVDVAAAGLLEPELPLWFATTLLADSALGEVVMAAPGRIIITDTNVKRAHRWGTLRENVGEIERVGQEPLVLDPTDNRLPVFADAVSQLAVSPDDTRTVAEQRGNYVVGASAYGNPVTYTNDDRAYFSVDGNPETSWEVAAFGEARGEFLRFNFDDPTELSQVTFLQPLTEENRHITEVAIRANNRKLGTFSLNQTSHTPPGQSIDLPRVVTRQVDIEITDLDVPKNVRVPGLSPVGFAEVSFDRASIPLEEIIRTPVAFVSQELEQLAHHDLAVVLTRHRSNPAEPVRDDPEAEMHRQVLVPAGRKFDFAGKIRLSAAASEEQIDELLGRTQTIRGIGIRARSSGRLAGNLDSAASFAFDNNSATAWTGEFGPQAGTWLEVELDEEVYVESLSIDLAADSLHSVPRRLEILADGELVANLPVETSLNDSGETVTLTHNLNLSFKSLRIAAVEVDERHTQDWYSNGTAILPISIVDVDLGEQIHFQEASAIETQCEPLLLLNGQEVSARISGSVNDALARRALDLVGCETVTSDPQGLLVQTKSRILGFDLDQLVLQSPSLTDPATTLTVSGTPSPQAMSRELIESSMLPAVEVLKSSDTSFSLRVPKTTEDSWLVMGQSHSKGWQASDAGKSLGQPRLIDGFANGWLLPAGEARIIELRWQPQQLVTWGLWISGVSVVIALFLALKRQKSKDSPPDLGWQQQPSLELWWSFDTPAATKPPPHQPSATQRNDTTQQGNHPSATQVNMSVTTQKVEVRSLLLVFGVAATFALINLPRLHWLAIIVGALAVASTKYPRWWNKPALLAGLVFGLTSLAIMWTQHTLRHPPDFAWPARFEAMHVFGVLVLILLFVDYLRSAVHRSASDP